MTKLATDMESLADKCPRYAAFVRRELEELKALGLEVKEVRRHEGKRGGGWDGWLYLKGSYYGKECLGFIAWDCDFCRVVFSCDPWAPNCDLYWHDSNDGIPSKGIHTAPRFADWALGMLE